MARRLVEQLGDDQFAAREQATTELLQLGLAAHDALQAGTRHLDREVRFRSERILTIVRRLDLDVRLDAFLNEAGKPGKYDFPAWELWAKEFGDTRETRKMFTLMVRAEPDLLAALERAPQTTLDMITARFQELQALGQAGGNELSPGTYAAMLLAANVAGAEKNPQAAQSIFGLCYQPSFRAVMQSGEHRPIIRRLLGDWIKRGDDLLGYQGVMLAIQHEMKEGLVPAERLLKNPNVQAQLRQYAVMMVVKMGDESHLPLLEELLGDDKPCGMWQVNNVNITTQLRDVALAGLLVLLKQEPKKFGFERLQFSQPYVFNPMSAGFESDEKRAQSIEKWRAYQAERKSASTAPQNEK